MTNAPFPNSARPAWPGRAVLRIIARPVRWPDLRAKADRAGLLLRWDALTEGGVLLVAATENPPADGSHVFVVAHRMDNAIGADQVSRTPAGQSGDCSADWRKEAVTQKPPMCGEHGGHDAR